MQRLTFFVLSENGSPVKQISISKLFLYFIVILILSGIGGAGYGVYDYYKLRDELISAKELEIKVAYQTDEIVVYRKQVQNFADEINTLKSKLLSLNGFEKQLKIIAGIEDTEEQEGLFGVGGSTPEDMDTKIQLTEKHNSLIREMHQQVEQLDLATTNQKKGFESLLKQLDIQRNLMASTPAIRPAKGMVTSKFGHRKSPFTGINEFHEGLDIANLKGTPIIAPADGKVIFSGENGGLGNAVVINHGHGLITRYGHLNECLKKQGETIKRGDVIGLMGKTGRSTGFHLHYEVHMNGVPINPENYILN